VTRLDELQAFIGFDDGDRARLRELHARLAPHFDAIAGQFYDAVMANPGTAAIVSGPAQIEHLRASLVDWMSSGLLGPHGKRFHELRSRVGQRHVASGLAPHCAIGAMTVLRLSYQDRIAEIYPPSEALWVMRSVHKLLDTELAIMLEQHEIDGDDQARRAHSDRITAMQTMSAGLAHEVRNPLNAAKLQLELLERRLHRTSDDPRLTEPIARAQKEIERLTILLNEFLLFARPPELHLLEHDIAAVVHHVVEVERATAAARGVVIEVDAAPDRPGGELAVVDVAKLHDLVQNLVRNAAEAVAPGGRVAVAVGGSAARCTIRVADDGPGIPDEVVPRIYEPFFTTKEGGTGLGMAIVHSLVALHGGTIDLATGSTGTAFTVSLPRRH
jgi:two-component system sensor histidine kinase HydH